VVACCLNQTKKPQKNRELSSPEDFFRAINSLNIIH